MSKLHIIIHATSSSKKIYCIVYLTARSEERDGKRKLSTKYAASPFSITRILPNSSHALIRTMQSFLQTFGEFSPNYLPFLLFPSFKNEVLTRGVLQFCPTVFHFRTIFKLRWLNTVFAVCEYMSFAKSCQEKGCSSHVKTWQVNNKLLKNFDWRVKFDVFVVSMAT